MNPLRPFLILCVLALAPLAAAQEREPWAEPYAEARKLALAGDGGEALDMLMTACRSGLDDQQKILLDPAFDAFHGAEMFHRIIRSLGREKPLRIARPDEPGRRVFVRGQLFEPAVKAPPAAAVVRFYQRDTTGRYGLEDTETPEMARLFGYVRTDNTGLFGFETVVPGVAENAGSSIEDLVPRHFMIQVINWTGTVTTRRIYFADDGRLQHPYWQQRVREDGDLVVNPRPNDRGELICDVIVPIDS